jgi:hypothetical protein
MTVHEANEAARRGAVDRYEGQWQAQEAWKQWGLRGLLREEVDQLAGNQRLSEP